MFTGLIEEVGVVELAEPEGDGRRLVVLASLVARDLGPGDSVSVNGCCQTVVTATDSEIIPAAAKVEATWGVHDGVLEAMS